MEIPANNRCTARGMRIRSRLWWRYALLLPICLTFGCQLAYFLHPDQNKDVKAEYGKIGKRTVAVLVWADQSTLDVDPLARDRICKAVTYHLRANLPKAKFIEPSKVGELQKDRSLDWEGMSNAEVCKRLECDLVMRLDLLEYTTRAGDTIELRKGRIRATINFYDGSSEEYRDSMYDTEIVATYPPDSIHGTPDMDESDLLHETVEYFAQLTARKFYDHEESLRGPSPD